MNIRIAFLLTVLLMIYSGCSSIKATTQNKRSYAPVEASLCHINQKVVGHFLVTGIPEAFNEEQYKVAVEDVCFSTPACRIQAEEIFDSFDVKARKVDDMFSVMLCDKDGYWKVMEDFSCNNQRVEVQSWKMDDNVPCSFEGDWDGIIHKYCNN